MAHLYNRLTGTHFESSTGNFEQWCVKSAYIYSDFLSILIRSVCIIISLVHGKTVTVDACWTFLLCRQVSNELSLFEHEEVIVSLAKEAFNGFWIDTGLGVKLYNVLYLTFFFLLNQIWRGC